MASTWIIIYPCGNRSMIGVAEICEGMEYEKGDYAIASRREFYDDEAGAIEYAKELAEQHRLHVDIDGHPDYLD